MTVIINLTKRSRKEEGNNIDNNSDSKHHFFLFKKKENVEFTSEIGRHEKKKEERNRLKVLKSK